jgi:hypothetical protein
MNPQTTQTTTATRIADLQATITSINAARENSILEIAKLSMTMTNFQRTEQNELQWDQL